jgi:hypothetical protein
MATGLVVQTGLWVASGIVAASTFAAGGEGHEQNPVVIFHWQFFVLRRMPFQPHCDFPAPLRSVVEAGSWLNASMAWKCRASKQSSKCKRPGELFVNKFSRSFLVPSTTCAKKACVI